MWFLKSYSKYFTLAILAATLTACSAGLMGGDITAQFSGIGSAVLLGPSTISIAWQSDPKCSNYQIYSLTSSTSQSLLTASVSPVVIRDPDIASEHSYSFAVACNLGITSSGLDVALPVTTWREFDGKINPIDTLPGSQFRLSWNYIPNTGTQFLIYAIESVIPGFEQKLTPLDAISNKGYRKGYVEKEYCSTYDTKAILGPNGDCKPNFTLNPGSLYQFRVVAKYPDNNYSADLTGNYQSHLMDASFTPPSCTLTHQGIGADSSNTFLYLRCSPNGAPSSCSFDNVSVTVFQGLPASQCSSTDTIVPGIGCRKPVSDTGKALSSTNLAQNLVTIQAKPGLNSTNDRIVENLEVEFTCNQGNTTQKSVVRYDGSQMQYPKPLMKFGNSNKPDANGVVPSVNRAFELAPEQSFLAKAATDPTTLQAPSHMGQAMAVGDFDCDGKPDLAVGLPDITYNSAPYFNEAPGSGAVKIYYNYAITSSGSISADSVQYLSFRDLKKNAHFGASLSAGNINKDVYKRILSDTDAGNYYSCDDLIIGAPSANSEPTTSPAEAFIFFGQPNKFPQQPLYTSDLAVNAPTCGGNFDSETCAPVLLDPNADFNNNFAVNQTIGYARSRIGYKVSYVRDFDADGYGDIVLSDPYCAWDGYITNGATVAVDNNVLSEVGCIYVYFGGPSGINSGKLVGTHSYDKSSVTSSFIKVFPPIPQKGMHFGMSLSGGGDIDGKYPVPVPMPGTSAGNIILANGNDFIVGAPDFTYNNFTSDGGYVITDWTSTNIINDDPDPSTAGQDMGAAAVSKKAVAPLNGAWADAASWDGTSFPVPSSQGANLGLYNSTGVAFAYLGRHSFTEYAVKLVEGAFKFPFGSLTLNSSGDPFYTQAISEYSKSSRDRQNGSAVLKLDDSNVISNENSPQKAFYNCGVRGTSAAPVSGAYRHYSCLAGRTNFTTLFPVVKDTDPSVIQYGSNVQILGGKEENAVALYNLSQSLGASEFVEAPLDPAHPANHQLLYQAQGHIHEGIRGVPLWEVPVAGFHSGNASDLTAGSNISSDSNATILAGSAQTGLKLARAPLTENLSVSGMISPSGGSKPQTDLNRDGYADVVVSTSSATSVPASVFTYFGNYAADFGYSYAQYRSTGTSPYATGANCSINTLAATGTGTLINGSPSTKSTFTNYKSIATSIAGSDTSTLTTLFPVARIPSNDSFNIYVDNTKGLAYKQNRTTDSSAGLSCKPQLRQFATTPTSLAAADLDFDGYTDLAIGFQNENSYQGKTSVLYAGANGIGLGMEQVLSVTDLGANFGSSVAAVSWKYIIPQLLASDASNNETYRRDLFVGASGRKNGAGAVFNFSSNGIQTSQVNSSASLVSPAHAGDTQNLYDTANAPAALMAGAAQIIGDINGDLFDDILVPVKRVDSNGSDYYDALIYFGSPMGPVTNSFCKLNVNKIFTQSTGGANITLADCLGASSSVTAYLNGTTIHLPQYLARPIGVGSTWTLSTFPAGDVNGDGKADVIMFQPVINDGISTHVLNQMYLFFGSDTGLVNGQPIAGPSSNRVPQLVTNQAPLPVSSWVTELQINDSNVAKRPIVHADFNNDGYEDLAFSIPDAYGPSMVSPGWICSAATQANIFINYVCGNSNSALWKSGLVVVIYGGPNGYQVPLSGDFEITGWTSSPWSGKVPNCGNFLTGCTSTNANVRDVYGSLVWDTGTHKYSIDTTKTACNLTDAPGMSCNGNSGSGGYATIIRNPIFYNTTDSWSTISTMLFGESLTVGDFNGDGIPDLAVGFPRYHIPDFATIGTTVMAAGTTNATAEFLDTNYGVSVGTSVVDTYQKGAVMIYYGSTAGIVAPKAQTMLADNGLGISGPAGSQTANDYRVTFMVSPPDYDATYGTIPELDASAVNRKFGMSTTTGDFNGDGYADLAVSSINGQVYVYYGPICGIDNVRSTWNTGAYLNHNQVKAVDNATTPGNCKVINLKVTAATNSQIAPSAPLSKALYPQMIYMNGIQRSSAHHFGSTLVSAMPNHGGNINGDPGIIPGDGVTGTSDLIVGGWGLSDSSVTPVGGKSTGMGYILFGHKRPINPSDLATDPGLYVSGGYYNGSIVYSNSKFHYAPVVLRPYETDGTVNQFFYHPMSIGDLNGDGTGDLLIPTDDLSVGGDINSTPVINGGGFRLIY